MKRAAGAPDEGARLTLKTYSHLSSVKRIPTEYEVATSQLHYYVKRGFEVNVPLREWYSKYQTHSGWTCDDWDAFRDPRETTYTTYTGLQRTKEAFVDGLFEFAEETGYDRSLSREWVKTLSRTVAPLCFPFHGFAMVAAYVGHMAPSGRITVAAMFQGADEVRRIQRIAYRTRALQLSFPGFGEDRRQLWQQAAPWQPLREAVEKLLCAYDWGEALVGLNLVLKPVVDELILNHLGRRAEQQGDLVLQQLFFSLNEDCQWQRQWTRALVSMVTGKSQENRRIVQSWVARWCPLGLRAVRALSSSLGWGDVASVDSEVEATCADFLRECGLEWPGIREAVS